MLTSLWGEPSVSMVPLLCLLLGLVSWGAKPLKFWVWNCSHKELLIFKDCSVLFHFSSNMKCSCSMDRWTKAYGPFSLTFCDAKIILSWYVTILCSFFPPLFDLSLPSFWKPEMKTWSLWSQQVFVSESDRPSSH